MPFVTRRYRFPLLVALIMLLATAFAFSQVSATGIAGVVKDPSDAVISGASVKIYNAATDVLERQMTTGNNGEFVATLLRPGTYRIAVSAQGFKNYESTVEVRIGETVKNVAKLQIGTGKESVTVEAIPSLVNTESATTGQPIDVRTLGALPLPTPNFMFLLTLSTGSMGEPPDVRAANRGNVDINVNGQRTSNNGVSLEGINVNDLNLAHFDVIPLPNAHAIQEFKTATSLYDASQGSKGGGAVNLVLKTGTKAWHGSAYWDHRNDALNANEWFHKQSQLATGLPNKPGRLLQNVFGGELGGPVPLLKGFWYGNIQGIRARNGVDPAGSTTQPTVPVLPGTGDVTAAMLVAPNCTSAAGAAIPCYGLPSTITAAQIDPTALAILNLKNSYWGGTYAIPRSGQPGCPVKAVGTSMSCFFSKITPIRDDQYTLTYDRPFSNGRQKIGLRWFWDNGNYAKPFGTDTTITFPRADELRNRFASISHTFQISDRQLNEFRFGFSRYNSVAGKPTDIISLADIGAVRGNSAEFPGIYRIGITSAWSLGTGVNDDRGTVNNQFYWGDTWSMARGRHNLRAGAEIVRFQINRYNNFAVRGALTFDNFANFLRGIINSEQNAFGDAGRYFRDTDFSFFFQDDFKLYSTLTVNLGLRWEGFGWAHDKFLRNAVIDPSVIQGAAANGGAIPILYPQDSFLPGVTAGKGIGDCGVQNCRAWKNFAPRVGFAWDIFGNQKTVMRGGFGIYYQRLSNQNLLQGSLAAPFTIQPITAAPSGVTLQNPLPASTVTGLVGAPFTPTGSFFAGLRWAPISGSATSCGADPGPPYNINNPCVGPRFVDASGAPCNQFGGTGTFPGPTNSGHCSINLASFSSVLPNARTPYSEQWNLSIQRDLGHGWAVEAAYVGAQYVGGLGIWQPFLAPLATAASPVTVKDTAGTSYTITQNTINNEPLRFPLLGLSRNRGYRIDGNIGFATYHSGQFTLSHRFSHGLYMQAGYTWSKNIDNMSGSQSTDELNATRTGQNGANIYNLQSNYQQNRARSDFDRPHRLAISYTYELPVPKHGIWGSQAFQGWSISGLTQFQNGLPFSLTDSSSGRVFGGGTGTGLLVCRPTAQQITTLPTCTPGTVTTPSQLLLPGGIESNLAHFINPNFVSISQVVGPCNGQTNPANCAATDPSSPTTYGNVPRNAFRAPFQQDWDVSVAKQFHIAERQSFQFRADFFNVFNHPIFQTPSSTNVNQTSPASNVFGLINSTAIPARIIQLGLKYSF